MSSEPVVYNQFLFRSLPFNPEKDFEPITNLFFNLEALVVNAQLKVRTIPDLIALAKAKPGTLSYGTFSFVLVQFMEKLKKTNDIDIVRVPFRSGNEVVNAIMREAMKSCECFTPTTRGSTRGNSVSWGRWEDDFFVLECACGFVCAAFE